jgi:trk system potassium uptake protein TrkA
MEKEKMKIIVVGGGRLGSELAYRLFQQGHKVTVIDRSTGAFDNLPPDFRGRTLEGDVLSQDVLHRAGIAGADGLAAVTNSDAVNAVVARIAGVKYGLGNVVVRNYDPQWAGIHQLFAAQVVSSAVWGAQQVVDLLHEFEVRPVFSAGNGEVKVYELQVPKGWHGRTLASLLSGIDSLPVALTRAGQTILPRPETTLETADILDVSAEPEGIQTLRQRLGLA